MVNSMSIKDAIQVKDQLSEDILALIKTFENQTECCVNDVDLHHQRSFGKRGTQVIGVDIVATLPSIG